MPSHKNVKKSFDIHQTYRHTAKVFNKNNVESVSKCRYLMQRMSPAGELDVSSASLLEGYFPF